MNTKWTRKKSDMRIKLLQTLWDAIATLDEFTEFEKENVRTELRMSEEKYDAASIQTTSKMGGTDTQMYFHTGDCLNKIFTDSDSNQDLMKIFVDEQKRLLRA